ncbi:MAG: DUF2066 domain-containing protein [Alphaproteobacteria bacterium]|nr:DUF2066 domain-containing protein [Alphaproteobacteria bacterium]
MALPHAALAQVADGVYQVTGVDVDVTAASAAEARDEAIAEGQARALAAMLRRLTRAIDWQRIPALRPVDAQAYVLDFEIVNERTSDVRYLADLNVRFRPGAIADFLRMTGIPFAQTRSAPVLVVPLLRQGDSVLLWEEANQWREAWATTQLSAGLVPIIVPFGDISDISEISSAAALRADRGALAGIAAKYGAQDSLIAVATLSSGGAGRDRVDVSLSRIGSGPQRPVAFTTTAGAGQDTATLLREAVLTSVERVRDAWISANVVQLGPQQVLNVEAQFSGLAGWVAITERLDAVSALGPRRITLLSRQRAELELTFAGGLPQLATALAQVGLALTPPLQTGFGRFAARPTGPQGLPIIRLAASR